MNCPKCGTLNSDTSRFCLRCGEALPQVSPTPAPTTPPTGVIPVPPKDQLASAMYYGGGAGAIGGALAVLGWFLPWFNLGNLMRELGGGLFGYGVLSSLFSLGSGVGNGLQLTLLAMTGVFASFRIGYSMGDSGLGGVSLLLGLGLLVLAGVLISIPIISVINVSGGVKLFELRLSGKKAPSNTVVRGVLEGIRNRSRDVLILLVIVFIILAAIPFGTALLGGGFFLTVIGSLVAYIGARLMANRVP